MQVLEESSITGESSRMSTTLPLAKTTYRIFYLLIECKTIQRQENIAVRCVPTICASITTRYQHQWEGGGSVQRGPQVNQV